MWPTYMQLTGKNSFLPEEPAPAPDTIVAVPAAVRERAMPFVADAQQVHRALFTGPTTTQSKLDEAIAILDAHEPRQVQRARR